MADRDACSLLDYGTMVDDGDLVDGRRTIGEIAALIREARPQKFARLPDAMARVSDVLAHYLRPR
jgi:hypothetical protein